MNVTASSPVEELPFYKAFSTIARDPSIRAQQHPEVQAYGLNHTPQGNDELCCEIIFVFHKSDIRKSFVLKLNHGARP